MHPHAKSFGTRSCNSQFSLKTLDWNCLELNALQEKYIQNQQSQIKEGQKKVN